MDNPPTAILYHPTHFIPLISLVLLVDERGTWWMNEESEAVAPGLGREVQVASRRQCVSRRVQISK